MTMPSLLLNFAAFATAVSAARLGVSVASSNALPNPAALPPSTHAVLLGPPGVRYDARLRQDNTFAFPALEPASYLLNVHSRDHFFPPLRIDVSKPAQANADEKVEAWQTFRGNEWSNKGPSYGSGNNELNLQIRASSYKVFYQTRGGFSLLSFLKSPMILMALVSVVMIFGLPYLMENMDPETRAEFEEMRKKGPISGNDGAATQMQNFDLAGWMAGSSSGSATGSATGSSSGTGSGSARKR